MTFSISTIFYKYKFKRYYSELDSLKNGPGAYVISKCEYDANSSQEICTVIDRGWAQSLNKDIDKILNENNWRAKYQSNLMIMVEERKKISHEEWKKIEPNIIPKKID